MFSVPRLSQRSQVGAVAAANRLRAGRSVIRMSAEARNSCRLHYVQSGPEAHSSGVRVLARKLKRPGAKICKAKLRMSGVIKLFLFPGANTMLHLSFR